MTDPDNFLDPEPEPEAEIEPVPEPFLSKATLLRNVPYIAALALAIFGVAYSSFSGHAINGYWEFLAVAMGLVCVVTGWSNAPDRHTRFDLIWTQVAHWMTILVAMNLVLLQGVQQVLPIQATGLVLMLLLGTGTVLAGIHLFSLRIAFLGVAMGLAIPAMTWFKQASLILLLAGVAIAGLAIAFWPRGRKATA
jgi:hypothetical protein